MNRETKISIYTQVYNTKRCLPRCIESLLNQTYRDFEYILIDNGSTDGCKELMEEYAEQDSRIRLVRFEENRPKAIWLDIAPNTGSGQYIAVLDSDDWLEPDFLERLLSIAEEKRLDIVCTGTAFNEEGQEDFTSGTRESPQQLILGKPEFAVYFAHYHVFFRTQWGKMLRRDTFLKSDWSITEREGIANGVDTLIAFSWLRQAKRIGVDKWPAFAATMASTHPDETLETLETGQPYAPKMAWINSSNFVSATCSDQNQRWYKALLTMEYTVATDLYMNHTIDGLADLFLPMSTFAEHDGFVIPYYMSNNVWLGCMAKAFSTGDTKSDLEICYEVGRRVTPHANWSKYNDVTEWLEEQLDDEPLLPFTWDEFKEMGVYFPPMTYKKYEKGMLRNDGLPGFNTVTSKFELYSVLYDAWGEDPMPYYEEPTFSQVSKPELDEEYPLMATSGARVSAFFHSEHRQIAKLRALNPDPLVEINPVTAAKYGIEDGDWVQVYNMFGKGNWRARVTPTIDERTIHCQHGWWFPEQEGDAPNLYGVFKSNFNLLVPHFNVGNLGFGCPAKGIMANIRKVASLEDQNDDNYKQIPPVLVDNRGWIK